MADGERKLLDQVMLRASRRGHRLFRNNSGVAFQRDGSAVRYGVAPGGSDLIGWSSVKVTPDMVGKTVAVFTAVEGKTGKLKPEKHQEAFLRAVRQAGGIGLWGTDPDEIEKDLP